ncbi:pentapeptide repeat-containing protein [Synechococcus sp. R3-13]|uniref:pentapeptide repeat-containing protein n=1 Tax=Synechococcus sp. R3-13 TaxID=2421316 RepID=UPI0039C21F7E
MAANLAEGNFFAADFRQANLSRCNLSQAALVSCQLQFANLEQAILVGANLRDAQIENTLFSGADFTDAKLSDETRKLLIERASGTNELTQRDTLNTLLAGLQPKSRKLFGLL